MLIFCGCPNKLLRNIVAPNHTNLFSSILEIRIGSQSRGAETRSRQSWVPFGDSRKSVFPSPSPQPPAPSPLAPRKGFPGGSVVKNPPAMQEMQKMWVWPLGPEDPWRRKWQPIPAFLPGKSQGQKSQVDYSPRGHEESNRTEYWAQHSTL